LVIGCRTLLSNACSNLGASVLAILAAGRGKKRREQEHKQGNKQTILPSVHAATPALHQRIRTVQEAMRCARWYLPLLLWRRTLFHRIECAELISALHAVDDARQIYEDAQAAIQQHTATSNRTKEDEPAASSQTNTTRASFKLRSPVASATPNVRPTEGAVH